MTREDYEELKRLRDAEYGDEINFIARDEDGSMWGFIQKPIRICVVRDDGQWLNVNGSGFQKINSAAFKSLKWEDDPIDALAVIADYEREHKEDA